MRVLRVVLTILIFAGLAHCVIADTWHFTATADQRGFDAIYDQLLTQMVAKIGGQGAFQVSPGDIDPPANLRLRIDARIGPTAIWYPGVGNHEEETAADMTWLRAEYNTGNAGRLPLKNSTLGNGPTGCVETTYAWDYGNSHCIMLNEYWNGGTAAGSDVASDGDIVSQLYAWLAADLAATTKPIIFVFGHEPAYPLYRHIGDSLDAHVANRDAFWNLLESDTRVKAYICGHTHYYSKYQKPSGRVWQIDVGDAGNDTDSNGKTFLDVVVSDTQVQFNVWRDVTSSGTFSLAETFAPPAAAVPVATPSQAKNQPNGTVVALPAVVSAAFPDFFYVGDTARTSGVRVNMAGHTFAPGTSVTLTGEIKTNPDGERYIETPLVSTSTPSQIKPVGVTHKSVGGSDWNLDISTGAGQRGVEDAKGLNNIGLLVRVAGKVTYSGSSDFYVDDGSGTDDGSGNKGMRVSAPGYVIPAKDAFVTFTGVNSCYKSGLLYYRQVLACQGFDRKTFTAFDDCVWVVGQYIGAHVTTYGIGSGFSGATSGPLVDYATGAPTGVTATLTQSGGVMWQPDPVTGGSDCNSGTQAYSTFGGIASMSGVIYYGSLGWWVDAEFSGLDPARSYEFVTSSNRNDSGYATRLTKYTISGADAFTNESTSGVVISNGGATSAFSTGYNTVAGYVARWTGIKSGTDGKFKVRAELAPGGDALKAYTFDVFKLAETL